ncbi:hypothetical protein ES703_43431 [subsurface metagenome]
MQWLIDLIIEAIGIPPTFIDRGDPATVDWTEAVLIEDGAWRDLDLSTIVPEGATAVALFARISGTLVGQQIFFRTKGNTHTINMAANRSQVADNENIEDLIVACDTNRVIQYKADADPWNWITITVKGWWL